MGKKIHLQVRMPPAEHERLVDAAGHRGITQFVIAAISEKIEKTKGAKKKLRKALAR